MAQIKNIWSDLYFDRGCSCTQIGDLNVPLHKQQYTLLHVYATWQDQLGHIFFLEWFISIWILQLQHKYLSKSVDTVLVLDQFIGIIHSGVSKNRTGQPYVMSVMFSLAWWKYSSVIETKHTNQPINKVTAASRNEREYWRQLRAWIFFNMCSCFQSIFLKFMDVRANLYCLC